MIVVEIWMTVTGIVNNYLRGFHDWSFIKAFMYIILQYVYGHLQDKC